MAWESLCKMRPRMSTTPCGIAHSLARTALAAEMQHRIRLETASRTKPQASSTQRLRRTRGPSEFRQSLLEDIVELTELVRRWWMMSTGFPLLAGTFGPLANLFSVCALVQTWRVQISPDGNERDGQRVPDPHWCDSSMYTRYSLLRGRSTGYWRRTSSLLSSPLARTCSSS